MGYVASFTQRPEPAMTEVEAGSGWQLLEFGTDWCGHCQAAQPEVQRFADAHALVHRKVEDGRGRPLGRAFRVKLWPTLVLLRDGKEQGRVVRPTRAEDLAPLVQAVAEQGPAGG